MNRIGIALLFAASTACLGQQPAKPDPLNADDKPEWAPPRSRAIMSGRWATQPFAWLPSDSYSNASIIEIGGHDSDFFMRFIKDGKVAFKVNNDGSVETADPANLDANTKEFWRMLALNYQLACKQVSK